MYIFSRLYVLLLPRIQDKSRLKILCGGGF